MDIKTILIIAVLGIIIFTLNVILDRRKNQNKPEEEKGLGIGKYFKAKQNFFSRSEIMFFNLMEKENNGKYTILSKVRLEDIVSVDKSIDWKDRKGKRGYIKSKHLDFVLLDDNKIISAIELDGNSHGSEKQKHLDEVKNEILEAVGIKFFRIRVGSNFEEEIKKIISN